jgi:hypothetical protein
LVNFERPHAARTRRLATRRSLAVAIFTTAMLAHSSSRVSASL